MTHQTWSAIFAASFALLTAKAFGWSAAGTVRSTTGTAVASVAVSVKDSAKYSAVTDAAGAFSLGSGTTGLKKTTPQSLSARMAGNEILIQSPMDGKVVLELVDVSGKTCWKTDAEIMEGSTRLPLPSLSRQNILFLRLHQEGKTAVQAVRSAADGLEIAAPRVAGSSQTYPTLQFQKSGFRDTSLTMTADVQSGIAVVMEDTSAVCDLPQDLSWTASDSLIGPRASNVYAIKDPTIQSYNGKWLVYATAADTVSGGKYWNMEFLSFTDFSKAATATPTYMNGTDELGGNYCAPELFYFSPKKTWYLTYQWGMMYSTSTTPDDPSSWSSPKAFTSLPSGQNGIDYYPICDAKNCYIFFTGDDGRLYRISTTIGNFPAGWGSVDTVVLGGKKIHGRDTVFEGSSTYKLRGLNKYLTLIEGMGTNRYFSAWVADSLNGDWTAARIGEQKPFAGESNVTYATGDHWSKDISHGELLRYVPDGTFANETQTVDACHLKLFFQGRNPYITVDNYIKLPYRLGLLTAN